MYHIHCLNKISPKGTALLTDNYAITDDRNQADGVLVRSADMHNVALPESLLAVARAGAGVNNIPLSDCAEAGVVVFNTPGANANSVMELALCGMLLSSRDVVGGINWVQTIKDDPDIAKLVEKGKSKFAGHEIRHKNLGVIGLGAVGGPLANAARNLGMTVYGCDPFISIEAAWHLDSHIVRVNNRDEIYSKCDIISLHTPLLDDTRGMINAEAIAKMKDGVIVLNFARDLLVDDDAMAAALAVLGKKQGRRIAVLGDMLELGDCTQAEHYRVGRIAAEKADFVFAYGPNSGRIISGTITGGMPETRGRAFTKQEELVAALKRTAKPGDVLLFKASHGIHLEQVIDAFLGEEK